VDQGRRDIGGSTSASVRGVTGGMVEEGRTAGKRPEIDRGPVSSGFGGLLPILVDEDASLLAQATRRVVRSPATHASAGRK
jgi:hypothetical protein